MVSYMDMHVFSRSVVLSIAVLTMPHVLLSLQHFFGPFSLAEHGNVTILPFSKHCKKCWCSLYRFLISISMAWSVLLTLIQTVIDVYMTDRILYVDTCKPMVMISMEPPCCCLQSRYSLCLSCRSEYSLQSFKNLRHILLLDDACVPTS